jgi:flagellar assembly factor FliW
MKTFELIEPELFAPPCHDMVLLPYGLLGFERIKNYRLIGRKEEEPFLWLQMLENAQYAFLLLPARLVVPDYAPDLDQDDLDFLDLTYGSEALVLNILTLGDREGAINLKAPIIINTRTWIGKQVIPADAADYSGRHPVSSHLVFSETADLC